MDPIPAINRAFAIVQQVEKQREVSGGEVEISVESNAMAAQRMYKLTGGVQRVFAHNKKNWRKDKNKFCDNCKMRGHTVDHRFKLIGYLEWYNTIILSV